MQEGAILESIRGSDLSEDERRSLDHHLPTVLHHGDVVIHPQASIDAPHLDSTQTHVRNFVGLSQGVTPDEPSLLPPGTRLGPYFGNDLNEGRPELRGRRIHYRIVFKEDCIPIRHQKSPSIVFKVLADVSEGDCRFLTTLQRF